VNELNVGDGLSLVCAALFGLHVVLVSALARDLSPIQLNAAQMAVAALLATPTALLHEGMPLPSPAVWAVAIFLGIVATALAFALQFAVQRHTTPTRTALILGLDPVVAVVFAAVCFGEAVSVQRMLGGGLMLLGVVVRCFPAHHTPSHPAA